MGEKFWWIYDIISVVVIIFFVFSGARKGFSKILITALGCVASIAAALFIGSKTTDFIYDKFFIKNNVKSVEEALEDYQPEDVIKTIIESNELSGVLSNEKIEAILKSGNSIDKLYDYANSEAGNIVSSPDIFDADIINGFAEAFANQIGINLPPYVVNEITKNVSNNEKLFNSMIDMLMNHPQEVPEFIEENYIREPAKRIINAAVFLIVFFILMTIITIVINRTVNFGLLNGFDRLDKFAGGILGIIEAAAASIIIAVAVKMMINISESDNSFISMNAVEKTKIFRYFYQLL